MNERSITEIQEGRLRTSPSDQGSERARGVGFLVDEFVGLLGGYGLSSRRMAADARRNGGKDAVEDGYGGFVVLRQRRADALSGAVIICWWCSHGGWLAAVVVWLAVLPFSFFAETETFLDQRLVRWCPGKGRAALDSLDFATEQRRTAEGLSSSSRRLSGSGTDRRCEIIFLCTKYMYVYCDQKDKGRRL